MAIPEREPHAAGTRSLAGTLFDNVEEITAAVLLVAIGLAMGAQVVLRTVFAAPLSWPEELSQFLFVWASLLGAVAALKRSELIRVDLIVSRLPPALQAATRWLVLVLLLSFLCLLGWKGWQLAMRTSFAAAALPITWAWAYAAIPAFAAIAAVRLLQIELLKPRFVPIESLFQ